MPTSKDVAKKAGVSTATISRVFNKPNTVSPKTREYVLKVAKELNYSPNSVARSLKSNKSNTIGVLILDIHNPFFLKILASISNMIKSFGYNLLVAFNNLESTDVIENIKKLLSSRVEAIIFTPTEYNSEIHNLLKFSQIYVLQLYGNIYKDFDSILIDDIKGMYMAVDTLLKNGHKRILTISDMDYFNVRSVGFNTACIDRKDVISKLINLNSNVHTEDELKRIINNIIKDFEPTGIISVTSALNFATLSVLKERGIKIPDEVSVINYDDSQYAELMGITSIGHDIVKISDSICSTLQKKLFQKSYIPEAEPTHKLIDPIFVKRHSIRKIY